jgi:hypothetical protein
VTAGWDVTEVLEGPEVGVGDGDGVEEEVESSATGVVEMMDVVEVAAPASPQSPRVHGATGTGGSNMPSFPP